MPEDTSQETSVPTVPQEAVDIYRLYVERGYKGATEPDSKDLNLYKAYVAQI